MRKPLNKTRKEIAVSESIGFIIIFGIMMTGIALVTLYGYPALLSQQSNANIRNMERNMIALQSDINSLTVKNVPYKETTMQISGGTLSVTRPNEMSNQYFSITNSSQTLISNFVPGALVYHADDGNTVICLENGAVHKRYWNDLIGSTMISQPRWFFDSTTQTLMIYLIQVNSDSSMAQTGIGNVQMTVSSLPIYSISDDYSNSPDTVTIYYHPRPDSNFKRAWQNYFTTFPENQYSGTDAVLEISNVKKLIVKGYTIKILSL
jgi:hypothetical protein